ncbi:MAG TPA: MetS family NSS transporter small subunit [Longimicrobiales bacterium]|nr:MetS family NSS transporter small subunit [Longimicrobiales bacterium]
MEATSIVMFVLIAGFVWGGFLTVLILALRKESAKPPAEPPPAPGPR